MSLGRKNILSSVQRLFSMFPTGTPGAALLVLRVSIAATLVVSGTAHWVPVTSFWILSGSGNLPLSRPLPPIAVLSYALFSCMSFAQAQDAKQHSW